MIYLQYFTFCNMAVNLNLILLSLLTFYSHSSVIVTVEYSLLSLVNIPIKHGS